MAALATHDEREQTLNQLLVEIDGFDGTKGVILMAATNRPEVLDPALLRAGRFDRQVVVDRPDVRGREEILRVHARRVKLDGSVDLRLVAQRTPGMVGADLERVVNEAALAGARRGSTLVSQHDFEEAVDRLQLGLKKQGTLMSPDEKRRVAFHEGGHTLVALSIPYADRVHRVTIIPRSIGALGATLQLPSHDRHLMTRDQLLDRGLSLQGSPDAIPTGARADRRTLARSGDARPPRAGSAPPGRRARCGVSDETGRERRSRPPMRVAEAGRPGPTSAYDPRRKVLTVLRGLRHASIGAIKDVAAAAAGVAIAVWIAVVGWEYVNAARLLIVNFG